MNIFITYFVHGTTTDNEKGLATGWFHGELSELGKRQAKELGELTSHIKFDVFFCSDLKRAVDSAKLGFGHKYKIIQDERLRECNYGDSNEKPEEEFKKNVEEKYINTPYKSGESYTDVEKRVKDFLNYLKKDYNGKRVAIVSHQAPQLAFEVLINKNTWKEAIDQDWRKSKKWQPGWEYELKDI